MNLVPRFRPLLRAMVAAGVVLSDPALAVRVNPDGHGQALIYPYYTARSTVSGHAFVTALSVTNVSSRPKAVRVRILEGRAGASVLDFNLFLNAYDVWTAGIVAAGPGAGIFSADNSCTSPKVSRSATAVTQFRNFLYAGDTLGDSLDRTYEGFFEILEMGAIDPESPLGMSVTHALDYSGYNTSKPSCTGLPLTDAVPAGLSRPTGGLVGNASYININEGTDFSIDAIALSRWSDKVQWAAPGTPHPNLGDASPAVSYVVDEQDDGDRIVVTQWGAGRDAVSAVLMAERVINDFTVEPGIKAATDWVVVMPTKRFYFTATGVESPFYGVTGPPGRFGEWLSPPTFPEVYGPPGSFYDREGQDGGLTTVCFIVCTRVQPVFPGSAGVWNWVAAYAAEPLQSSVMASKTFTVQRLGPTFFNGWGHLAIPLERDGTTTLIHRLAAPAGATTVVDVKTGTVIANVSATYFGLPLIGFAAQSYSTNGLPGIDPNVLSNSGGTFSHKFTRRIEVAQ